MDEYNPEKCLSNKELDAYAKMCASTKISGNIRGALDDLSSFGKDAKEVQTNVEKHIENCGDCDDKFLEKHEFYSLVFQGVKTYFQAKRPWDSISIQSHKQFGLNHIAYDKFLDLQSYLVFRVFRNNSPYLFAPHVEFEEHLETCESCAEFMHILYLSDVELKELYDEMQEL
jgi:hypothetical protein